MTPNPPAERTKWQLRIDNLRAIGSDKSVNNFARSVCADAAEALTHVRPLETALAKAREDYREIVDYVMGYFPVGMCYVNPIQAMNVVIARMQKAEADAARWEKEAKINAENFSVTNAALVKYDNARIDAEKLAESLAKQVAVLRTVEQDAAHLRSQLEAARACIRGVPTRPMWSAGDESDMQGWRDLHAPAIESAREVKP